MPTALQRAVAQIGQIKLFQGDNYIDDVMYGETHRVQRQHAAAAHQLHGGAARELAHLATEVAKRGMPLQQHATISETFPFFLDQIEAINKEYPIRNLRWAFATWIRSRPTISTG